VNLDGLNLAVIFVVGASWLGLGIVLVLGRKQGAAATETKRDTKSGAGMVLQGLGYAIVFAATRTFLRPMLPIARMFEIVLAILTAAIAIASIWFCYAAARTLGKQWALVARVTEGHELVTTGPYSIVRNPIYVAMFGMLVATGLAISQWQALAAAIAVFLIGTEIRIRSEENLLREAFGAKFDDYARRVPAFFPRLF
jgi:protein-S-isoprenylcysteine O-methyltransferase Ste14